MQLHYYIVEMLNYRTQDEPKLVSDRNIPEHTTMLGQLLMTMLHCSLVSFQ